MSNIRGSMPKNILLTQGGIVCVLGDLKKNKI